MNINKNKKLLGLFILLSTTIATAEQGFDVEVVREPAETLKANIQNRSSYNQRVIMASSAPEREARVAINEENCRNQNCTKKNSKNLCLVANEIQNIYLESSECNFQEVEEFCYEAHIFAETTVSSFKPSQASFQQGLKQLLKTKVQPSKLIENYRSSVLLRNKISETLSEIIQNDKRCEAVASNYLAKTPQCKQRYASILTPERVSFISKYCSQSDIDKSLEQLKDNMEGFSETAETIATNHKGARELERAMKSYLILVNEHIKSIEPTRFFKTGKGEYGYGDIFIGVRMPAQREIAKKHQDLPTKDTLKLVTSKVHEERMTGLLILVNKYKSAQTDADKNKIYQTYVKHFKYVNNWDLVDVTCPHIVGIHLMDKDRKALYKWAKSKDLWTKRIAMVSNWWLIRKGDLSEVFKISEILLKDEHDLIHKAVGWMLREAGKKDLKNLESFLKKHYTIMPRTMLRYSIEKFPETKRQKYLKGSI